VLAWRRVEDSSAVNKNSATAEAGQCPVLTRRVRSAPFRRYVHTVMQAVATYSGAHSDTLASSAGYDPPRTRTCRVRHMAPSTPDRLPDPPLAADETVQLLEAARQGDHAALERLFERCLPALRRWAHSRLPLSARGMLDTSDLVQDTVMATLGKLDRFEARHQGALQAYLRQAVMNRIRDVLRYRRRRPQQVEMPVNLADRERSPLELAIGAENVERYEQALARLSPSDREAIIGRFELQYSYDELALSLDKPSAAAARMAVTRAIRRIADEMHHG
jgi:RNA polymerase sigma-70 factor, ECF subfamily